MALVCYEPVPPGDNTALKMRGDVLPVKRTVAVPPAVPLVTRDGRTLGTYAAL
jgi:hypothetical protein